MSQTSIICPHCQAALRLPAAMPAGRKPKCPRCGTLIAAAVPPARLAPAGPSVNGVTQIDQTASRRADPFVVIGIVLGSGLLLVLLTGGLLFICLRNVGSKSEVASDEEPVQASQPTPTPAAPKANVATAKPLIALSAEDAKKIDVAIQKGVAYLKSKQIQDVGPSMGSWANEAAIGYTALAGLTLLESNVPAQDRAVQAAANYVRANVNVPFAPGKSSETYEVSITILFLSRLNEPSDRQLIRSLALRLVAGQRMRGGWNYDSKWLTPEQETRLLAMLQAYPGGVGQPADPSDDLRPAFVRPDYNGPDLADNSNTQFALLALLAARRYDLPLDPVLRLVAKHFRDTQYPDGSWKYHQGSVVSEYPTMTAAGLLGLAVGYGLDSSKTAADMTNDEILQKAFKHLAARVGNPGEFIDRPPPVELYFLWSIERVAVLYHLATINGKDWFHWGLEILLAHQYGDGKWMMQKGPGSSDIVDTCFALLFLQRANLTKDLSDKIEQMTLGLGQGGKEE